MVMVISIVISMVMMMMMIMMINVVVVAMTIVITFIIAAVVAAQIIIIWIPSSMSPSPSSLVYIITVVVVGIMTMMIIISDGEGVITRFQKLKPVLPTYHSRREKPWRREKSARIQAGTPCPAPLHPQLPVLPRHCIRSGINPTAGQCAARPLRPY